MSLQILRKGENEMAKKEVKTDLWVARQLNDSKIKYDAQGSDVKEINDALQSASKRGTGNAGYPEYVAVVKDFVIVIEDKADLAKHQKLTSTGILSVDQKDIADYAVNGAYFYAKHIAQNSSFHKILQSAFLAMKSTIESLHCMWMIEMAISSSLILNLLPPSPLSISTNTILVTFWQKRPMLKRLRRKF